MRGLWTVFFALIFASAISLNVPSSFWRFIITIQVFSAQQMLPGLQCLLNIQKQLKTQLIMILRF